MWKDLGFDNVKKGFDSFVKKAATVVVEPSSSQAFPPVCHDGQYVGYTMRQAPHGVDDYQDVEAEVSLFHVPITDRSVTVGDIRSHFPVKANSCSFRFKIEDDFFQYVFLEGLGDSDIAPTFRGSVVMDVLLCPTQVKGCLIKTEDKAVLQQPALPSRKELVRQREESQAAQVKAARAFAAANATDEANRRQEKMSAQNQLGAVLDKWALTEQGKFKDVRSLLSSMNMVLWDNSGWSDVPLGELMINDATVKKSYRRAIVLCHPDRHQKESADQQYRADRIFNAINESYKIFTSSPSYSST